jgi:hypothetical protein
MGCYFCFAEGLVPKLSKEHLLSRPVAEAFGLDRSGAFGQWGNGDESLVLSRLDDVAVRFVCERCNNTWMNSLEHDVASLSTWTGSPDQALTPAQVEVLRSWSLKTYLILCAMVGGTRRFAEDPQAPGVIPNFTRARQLYEKSERESRGPGPRRITGG